MANGLLFLVRHGQTAWSRTGRHTGRTDIPLEPEGRAEAEAVGRLLAGHDFALVLTSPLSGPSRPASWPGSGTGPKSSTTWPSGTTGTTRD